LILLIFSRKPANLGAVEFFLMEINGILFLRKSGALLPAAASEVGLKHFEEHLGLEDFGLHFHPGPALPASGQMPAVFGNPGDCHSLSLDL
jgi:hypothetical protein